MRPGSLLFLLCANLALAQQTSSVVSGETSMSRVGPDVAVITLHGYCDDKNNPDDQCATVITRAQFEQLAAALQPGMTTTQLLKVANAYARNMRMAALAEQRGIDKTESFLEQMRYARLQLLSQDLEQELLSESHRISDSDINDYFRAHQVDFESATLERIFVPHAGKSSGVDAGAMAQLAVNVREKLTRGVDADQLQREVFEQASLPVSSTGTRIEKIRRDSLAPNHAIVMALQPGQVSDVISDPAGAHFIYKMLEKRAPTLAEVRDEVTKIVGAQRYHDSVQAVQGVTVFSDDYFNAESKPGTPAERRNRGSKKTSDSE